MKEKLTNKEILNRIKEYIPCFNCKKFNWDVGYCDFQETCTKGSYK